MVSARGQLAALAALVALVPSSVLGVAIYGQCGGIGYSVSRIHPVFSAQTQLRLY